MWRGGGGRAVYHSLFSKSPFHPRYSSISNHEGVTPTGILLLNMGGPRDNEEVGPFLRRLFQDKDIMQLPMQDKVGAWIARRRTPSIAAKYGEIGGGSPILKWTEEQGTLLCKELDKLSPSTAPHKHYVGFRYAKPLTEESVEKMERDGIRRAIAFSQYPQYSCATTGSSIHALQECYRTQSPKIKWSFIDRWSMNEGLVTAVVERIKEQLPKFPKDKGGPVVILFSAHSLPMKAVNRGDPYPAEVAATVQLVMNQLGNGFPYRLVWQSKVGPVPWLRPSTEEAIKGVASKGLKNILLVPIAFVNEHIETLHEMDIEYAAEMGEKLGITIRRASCPNDHPAFITGMAEEVVAHLRKGEAASSQLLMTCPLCTRESCRDTKQWLSSLNKK